jgi:GTP-binding protein
LKVLSAEFVRSAAGAPDFPRDPVPQVAFVGRSNVGKSSLINGLVKRTIARTSAAAGKTRHVNIYRLSLEARALPRLFLVDLPGYGYARGGTSSAQGFEALTTAYFACPPVARAAVAIGPASSRGGPYGPSAALLVVDSRHPGLEADRKAWEWLEALGRPAAVVASKVDKLTRAERERSAREWQAALKVPVLPVSVVTGEGLKELWTVISRLLESSRQTTPAPSA